MSIAKYLTTKVTSKVTRPEMKQYSIWYYTGGIDIDKWNELTCLQKERALSKDWCICWSYRKSKNLIRQDNIKGGVNKFKTKAERLKLLKSLKKHLVELLDSGFSPYDNTTHLLSEPTKISIEEAIKFSLEIWERTIASSTYSDYKSKLNKFYHYLKKNGLAYTYTEKINRRVINTYLNETLKTNGAKNRNNIRACLSSFFSLLVENEYTDTNPVAKIKQLRTSPTRNKTYSNKQMDEIFSYLEEKNPQLLLYIKFVAYNFLRPIEVCRLTIADVNLEERRLTVKAKNSPLKTKVIPEILIKEILHFSQYPANFHLFSPSGSPNYWNSTEINRRDYMTKQFLKVKKALNLSKDYTIYSFRHTLITKLYRELRKQYSPFEAKSRLMLITGHASMKSLEQYLRDIDAELPEDWSYMIKN